MQARRTRFASLLAAIWLAGCATAPADPEPTPQRPLDACGLHGLDGARSLDVAITIDSSTSMSRPSGVNADGNERIGTFTRSGAADRADSMLAAQVASIRVLAFEAAQRDLRLSLISFAGPDRFNDPPTALPPRSALVRVPLTSNRSELDAALRRVLRDGGSGMTDFATAMNQSLKALEQDRASATPRRGVVLMISDSPTPVRRGPTVSYYRTFDRANPNPNSLVVRSDPAMAIAARRAIRSRIRIHTFGLGEAADTEPPHDLSRIAGATGGSYRAVADPTRLHCDLLSALAR